MEKETRAMTSEVEVHIPSSIEPLGAGLENRNYSGLSELIPCSTTPAEMLVCDGLPVL